MLDEDDLALKAKQREEQKKLKVSCQSIHVDFSSITTHRELKNYCPFMLTYGEIILEKINGKVPFLSWKNLKKNYVGIL